MCEMTKDEAGFWVKGKLQWLNKVLFDDSKRVKDNMFLSAEQFAYVILRYWWNDVWENLDVREKMGTERGRLARECIDGMQTAYQMRDAGEITEEEFQERMADSQVWLAGFCTTDVDSGLIVWDVWANYVEPLIMFDRTVAAIVAKGKEGNLEGVLEEPPSSYMSFDSLARLMGRMWHERDTELAQVMWDTATELHLANVLNSVLDAHGM